MSSEYVYGMLIGFVIGQFVAIKISFTSPVKRKIEPRKEGPI